jgi:polyketide synthase PksN
MIESENGYIFGQSESKKHTEEKIDKVNPALGEKTATEPEYEDIAIIGMACKFPGAKNIDEYWSNLKTGVNSIKEPSKQRRDDTAVYYKNQFFTKYMLGFTVSKDDDLDGKFGKSGYLDEIDKFDAGFFHITPREAKFMEPVQRVFLETAWEAIEDAGYGGNKIIGTKTGVFAGRDHAISSMYQYISEPDSMHLTGSWTGILASRIQYIFNMKGPSIVVDTACSSGLTATHMACRSLMQGDCDMALSGGIHLIYLPSLIGQKSSTNVLESADGKIRTFDKEANGTVWGEGVGILFLKKLSKALKDGDNIHAVIKGSAINNDGASNGITAPNADAQEDVIIDAWNKAGIDPRSVSYIEAHGTGTILGDSIEIQGLTNAFRRYTDKNQFCGIGSVKTNFGHLVAASGMASIIKIILSLKNKMIPATINLEVPNPYIDFCNCPVYVNDELRQWDTGDTPRRAGVSSFGFSGTNCHIVLEEAPEIVKRKSFKITKEKAKNILAVSARSENVLKDLLNKYIEFIIKGKVTDLNDICYTANTGRRHFTHRLAFVLNDFEDFKEKLLQVKRTDFNNLDIQGVYYKEHKIVSENKKVREAGEITESRKREISEQADTKISELAGHRGDLNLYDEICKLYIEGGNIDWDMLYKGQDIKKVSLPVYPFERVRYWAAPKVFDMEYYTAKATDSESNSPHESVISLNTAAEYVPPANKAEEELVSIWQEVLGIDRIGVNDNFFEIGGHSLKAVAIRDMCKMKGIEVSAHEIFMYGTVKNICDNLSLNSNLPDIQDKIIETVDSDEINTIDENKYTVYDYKQDYFWRSNFSSVKLKVTNQNEVTAYSHYAYPLAILLAYNAYKPWFYENFIQLYAKSGENGSIIADYLGQGDFYTEVMDSRSINYSMLGGIENITLFIVENLGNGNYVYADLNHGLQDVLIYGYEILEKRFLAMRLNNNCEADFFYIGFEEMEAAFEGAADFLEDNGLAGNKTVIKLFAVRKVDYCYTTSPLFDIGLFFDKINNYLSSWGNAEEACIDNSKNAKAAEPEKIVFGLDVTRLVIDRMEKSISDSTFIDHRYIHLLAEHKRGMLVRLKFAAEFFNDKSEIAPYIEKYKEIVNDFEKIRKNSLKITGSTENSVKASYYCEFVEIMKSAIEKEKEILADIFTVYQREKNISRPQLIKKDSEIYEYGTCIRKELKIKLQKQVNSYLNRAYPLCILFCYDHFAWYNTHMLQICAQIFDNNYVILDYQEEFYFFKKVMDFSCIGYKQVNHVENITDYIIEKIDNGVYVNVCMDEYYLKTKESYMKNHFVHETLIFGYDNLNRRFLGMGFDNDGFFNTYYIEYDNFNKAFEEGKIYYKESAPYAENSALTFYTPRKDTHYMYDIGEFLYGLNCYLESRGNRDRVSVIVPQNSDNIQLDKMNVQYGVNAVRTAIDRFKKITDNQILIDYRSIHLLAEHKKGMLARLEFAACCRDKEGNTKELIERYKEIVNDFESIRIKVLEMVSRQVGNIEENNIQRIIEIMEASIEKEIEILKDIYEYYRRQDSSVLKTR